MTYFKVTQKALDNIQVWKSFSTIWCIKDGYKSMHIPQSSWGTITVCLHRRSNHLIWIINKMESVSIPTIIGKTTDRKNSCSPKWLHCSIPNFKDGLIIYWNVEWTVWWITDLITWIKDQREKLLIERERGGENKQTPAFWFTPQKGGKWVKHLLYEEEKRFVWLQVWTTDIKCAGSLTKL